MSRGGTPKKWEQHDRGRFPRVVYVDGVTMTVWPSGHKRPATRAEIALWTRERGPIRPIELDVTPAPPPPEKGGA
jgi:hypothetical protein